MRQRYADDEATDRWSFRTPDGFYWSYEDGEFYELARPADAWDADGRRLEIEGRRYHRWADDIEDAEILDDEAWYDDDEPSGGGMKLAAFVLVVLAVIFVLIAGQGAVAPGLTP